MYAIDGRLNITNTLCYCEVLWHLVYPCLSSFLSLEVTSSPQVINALD